jgi:5S rRNA maturation endonuclease (ribonuclease M5)
MSNMLKNTGITYFQIPNCFLSEDIYKKITKTQQHLYLFLWKESQHNSTLTLKYAGKDLAEKTFLVECQVNAARVGLVKLGLIQVEKVSGGYEYSLCHPDSGHCISNPRLQAKGYDFDKMTADENAAYYLHRIRDETATKTKNGLLSRCPLCKGDRRTFEVKTVGGLFHCHKCEAKGKLVSFEVALALSEGYEISRGEAHKRVCDGLRACNVTDVTTGKPEAEYSYSDADGEILFEVVRFPGKNFRTRKMNKAGDYVYKTTGIPKMLYRLPEVLQADTVFVVEGEKDADRLQGLKLRDSEGNEIAATTNSHGANHWKKEHTMHLEGKRVILIGDTDERGVRHMDDVQEQLTGWADVIRIELPFETNDVSRFLEINDLHAFMALLPETWIEAKVAI